VAWTVTPETTALDRETLRTLYRCLERISEKRRVAFVLCAIEGFSPAEAAVLEGTRPETMRARLCEARDELARRLSAHPEIASRIKERR
jgi:RNA polymerase sigma-70 factor (ECF subfamily)